MKHVLTALAGVLAFSQSASSQTREDFTLGGFSAFVIVPNTPAPGNPWIAYAPSVGGLPSWTGGGAEAWMFNQYFAAGIAVAGIYSGDLSGNPAQRAGYTDLYAELVGNRGYATRFSFHTRSRGGLLGYNWAADNPGKVAAIGGIYPVTNLLSYPGQGTAASHYGITVQELNDNGELYNPIDRLLPLFNSGVKMFHIHGDSDGTVPLNQNSQITKDRYDVLGGDMTLTVIAGGGHDFNSHWWTNQPLTDFMIAETLAAASTVGPPTLDTLSSVVPADDATGVTISSDLQATFSEAIALTGSGTINLKNLSGGADIPVTLPGDVTILGAVLTINPASDLVGGEEYAVELSSDAIEDLDSTPNPYAGLLSTDTPNWSFTGAPPDLTNPTTSSMDPTAGESDVSPSADLTLTLDEDVQAGSGIITIHLASNDSVVETIGVTSGAVTILGAEVSIDIAGLAANTSYYVNIAAGAIKDLSGNPFAGFTDKTTWAFTTGDQPSPVPVVNPSFEDDNVGNNGFISSAMGWTVAGPLAGAQDYSDGQNPQPTDNEQHAFANGGSSLSQVTPLTITAGETYTLTVDVGQLSNFSGSLATIRLFGSTAGIGTALSNTNGTAELSGMTPPSGGPYLLDQAVTYTALASGDPFDGQQVGIALIGSSGTQVLFDNVRLEVIAAGGPPTLNTSTSVVPADDAAGVAVSSNLEATFSKDIALTGMGTVNLKNLSGGADIPITLPGDVTILGSVLTIDPASDLVDGDEYTVEISSNAIEDLETSPNPYAGLLSTDVPNWSFTAAVSDVTNPTTSSMVPMAGENGVALSTDLTLTFDEDVQAQTGNITIHLTSNDSVVETIGATSGAVTISGGVVTIDIGGLAATTSYYVNIAAGAFEDLSGNPFAGITGKTTWAFTTGDSAGPLSVTNPSFEEDAVNDGAFVNGLAAGWDTAGNVTGTQDFGSGTAPTATEGEQHGVVSFQDFGGSPTSLSQLTTHTISAGQTYTLTVDVGQVSAFSGSEATIFLFGATTGIGTPLTNTNGTAELAGIAPGSGAYLLDQAVTYTALASADPFEGEQIGIGFLNSAGTQTLFDNVRLTATAPPPTNTFSNWIGGFGLDPADRDFGDDPDRDNLPNGLEAWFGTHPGEFNEGLADIATDGTTTTFTHAQNETPPSDLSGFYEWSLNLADWYAGDGVAGPPGGPTVAFVPNTVGATTTVTATASEALDGLFLRIGVVQN